MDDSDANDLWKVVAGVAAAGFGVWILSKLFGGQARTPEEEEAQAWRDFAQPLNAFDPEDLERHNEALRRVNVARAKKKVQEMIAAGYPLDSQTQLAMVDLARYKDDLSLSGWEKVKAATVVLATAPIPGPGVPGPQVQGVPRQPRRMRCTYCDGIGWYVCHGCHGRGRNNLMPPPQYTGNPVADALINFKYDDRCPSCKGQPQVVCSKCRGLGFIEY